MLVGILTSCGLAVPRPEVKEGEFDVSVTYEANGETKTLDLVYICEYDGVKIIGIDYDEPIKNTFK